MSKTPRTDAQVSTNETDRRDVPAAFARKLELELSASTAALAAARDGLNHIRGLVTNENSLTYDEIMEHIEKHTDISLAASNPNHP